MKDQQKNVIIIGGGAAGLSAAIYLARAGLNPLLFAGSPPGGQLVLTSEVENYPGYENILGAELIAKMRAQAQKFGTIVLDENIQTVVREENNTYKVVSGGKDYVARALIIATGAKALWIGLESETRLRGKGVSACATCDGFFFRNKNVVVVGGGDTALEEALTLTKFASKVYIVHRRDSFRGSKIMQKRVFENSKIEVIWNAQVTDILGETKVERINLKIKDKEKELKVDGVFVAIGHKPDTDLFKSLVTVDKKGYVVTSSRYGLETAKLKQSPQGETNEFADMKGELFDLNYQTATSAKGIFAAGDCSDIYYRQASTASGMGVSAALDVERWLESQ